jgi:uncharacterized membrane protein YsdA (DUF1294 family)
MPYLLLALAAIVFLFGVAKVSRVAQSRRTPWGSLLVWAVLFGAGLTVWLMSARIH